MKSMNGSRNGRNRAYTCTRNAENVTKCEHVTKCERLHGCENPRHHKHGGLQRPALTPHRLRSSNCHRHLAAAAPGHRLKAQTANGHAHLAPCSRTSKQTPKRAQPSTSRSRTLQRHHHPSSKAHMATQQHHAAAPAPKLQSAHGHQHLTAAPAPKLQRTQPHTTGSATLQRPGTALLQRSPPNSQIL